MQDARAFKPGDRVVLVRMDDPLRDCPIGAEGTVRGSFGPPLNCLNVEWDCGFRLNPQLDVDEVALVP